MSIEKAKRSITSVKIPDVLYEDFKVMSIRTKMNLQDIVERSIYLYLTNNEYRQKIHETYSTYYTGSHLLK
jgi:hypothetical protein